ncbi:MAG: GAF domain-containing protein, partial [Nitrospirota bacterium]|nr:GAF domain-containing protein [Nitrospirota bacterium]
VEDLATVAAQHIGEVFESQIAIFLSAPDGRLVWQRGAQLSFEFDPKETGLAQWVYEHGQAAGLGSDTLPGAGALYLPMVGAHGPVGVLAVRPSRPGRLFDPEQLHLLETFAGQIALAIERVRLAEEAQRAQVLAETERMRNAILSSVSHDLRTPLATVTGAASSLLEGGDQLDVAARQDLANAIYGEAARLDRLVKNLLDMTRLEAGAVQPKKEWHPIEEIVGAALTRLEGRLHGQSVRTQFPPDLPLVHLDGVLIEQVLVNLLENALKYASPGGPIELSAARTDDAVIVEVADRGPGLQPGDEQRVFDKFYRGSQARKGGVGLGLTICRGIVEAHGGRIWAENRPGGGAAFRFTLPLEEAQPTVEPEQAEPHPAA